MGSNCKCKVRLDDDVQEGTAFFCGEELPRGLAAPQQAESFFTTTLIFETRDGHD